MSDVTVKRDGGWRVELRHPLRYGGRTLEAIDIRQPTLDHVVRWSEGRIGSTLALLAELSDVPELILREMNFQDADRVLLALANVLPPTILEDFKNGRSPMASPQESLPQAPVDVPDQLDARFPKVDGPVQRFEGGVPPPHIAPTPVRSRVVPGLGGAGDPDPNKPPPPGLAGEREMNLEAPEVMRQVGH